MGVCLCACLSVYVKYEQFWCITHINSTKVIDDHNRQGPIKEWENTRGKEAIGGAHALVT